MKWIVRLEGRLMTYELRKDAGLRKGTFGRLCHA